MKNVTVMNPARGWICSCTGVWIERVDFSLDCHHWPLCEHVVRPRKRMQKETDNRGRLNGRVRPFPTASDDDYVAVVS